MVHLHRVDKIGSWSRQKLILLGKYLETYTSILNTPKNYSWFKGCYYIDAFAGSVTPWDKDAQEYIDGSPLVALKTIPSFNGFVFIEKDEKRLEGNIKPLIRAFPEKDIRVLPGDCNEILITDILPKFLKSKGLRGFIFLDPYGLELCWDTVEAIGLAGVFDVFVNFSVMGVYRQLGNTPPPENVRATIDAVMGTKDWLPEAYQRSTQLTLSEEFSPRVERKNERLPERLTECYRKQLKTCFAYVSKGIMMRNASGGPIYSLILASQKELAIKKMHDIFLREEKRSKHTK